ncbi:MAG: hypothetical protein LBE62_10975 [Azonexus sp.]|jgi:hypothetical protein|nr:hypothetical protein [Azonexus sp.]
MTEAATPYRYEPTTLPSASAVVAEFVHPPVRKECYPSEVELEHNLIKRLRIRAYGYRVGLDPHDILRTLKAVPVEVALGP